FLFSSRRRHTSFSRDWSSDVCSSDLTALRIFYGLDRFSEDLDFSLLERDPDFSLSKYMEGVRIECASLGMNVSIKEKKKTKHSRSEERRVGKESRYRYTPDVSHGDST